MKHGTWILGRDSTFFCHEREIDSRRGLGFSMTTDRGCHGFRLEQDTGNQLLLNSKTHLWSPL
jgi:hypothetical protein